MRIPPRFVYNHHKSTASALPRTFRFSYTSVFTVPDSSFGLYNRESRCGFLVVFEGGLAYSMGRRTWSSF